MRSTLLTILALLTLATLAPMSTLAQVGGSDFSFTYVIDVGPEGNATVTILFEGRDVGKAYLYLPLNFSETRVDVLAGQVRWLEEYNRTYFYREVDFAYGPGTRIRFSYDFPYAVLKVGEDAWFMTPLINFSITGDFVLRITLGDLDEGRAVKYYPVEPSERRGRTLVFNQARRIVGVMGRVIIQYHSTSPPPEEDVVGRLEGTEILVKTPVYYRSIARKIINTYRRTYEEVRNITGFLPERVEVRFYLPRLENFMALGYVDADVVEVGVEGPLNLNLVLIRFAPGYTEYTFLHELTHLILGKLGVGAGRKIRFFHEGMADYTSFIVLNKTGYPVWRIVHTRLAVAEEVLRRRGDLSFVVEWDYGNPAPYYSAAFYIVYSLGEKFGRGDYLRRVYTLLRERGGVRNPRDVARLLADAAGSPEAVSMLEKWGFRVRSPVSPVVVNRVRVILLAAGVATGVLGILLFLKVGRSGGPVGYGTCPYCGYVVREGTLICPNCGRRIVVVSRGVQEGPGG